MQLNWQRVGEGPHRAVALHCKLASSKAWRPLGTVLGHALTLEACDMPGHGASPDWDDALGEYQGVTAQAVADWMPGPMDVIGHSFGGTVALRLAIQRPDLVRSLTLIEPVMFAAALADDAIAQMLYTETFAPFAAAWEAGDRAGAARAFTEVWGAGTRWHQMLAVQREMMVSRIHLIPAANAGIVEDVGGIVAGLEKLNIPVLLIDGARSPAIIDRIQMALAERLPKAQRVTVPDAGHMLPFTHPAEVARPLAEFLRL